MSDECRLACGTVAKPGAWVQRVDPGWKSRITSVESGGVMFRDDCGYLCRLSDYRAVPQEQHMNNQSSDDYAAKLREIVERWKNGGWKVPCRFHMPSKDETVDCLWIAESGFTVNKQARWNGDVWIDDTLKERTQDPSYWRPIPQPPAAEVEHDYYKTGDPDAPDMIKDNNGDVVLSMCKRCGKAESELSEPCKPRTTDAAAVDEGALVSEELLKEIEIFPGVTLLPEDAAEVAKEIRRLQARDKMGQEAFREINDELQVERDFVKAKDAELAELRAKLAELKADCKELLGLCLGGMWPVEKWETIRRINERLGD